MATAETQAPPTLPDYLLDPNAVMSDVSADWRYGKAPDYTNTRKVYAETKTQNHAAGSLPNLVENLVKNWEVEASFKKSMSDWRTVDHANYTFAINGGPPQTAEHMLKVGTYNAIIAANDYYDPANSDFAESHKVFKRMMPTFAWEVLEVYSGPPVVAFKWRHWGTMKNDYVGKNNKGEKVRIKAHGGSIDIQGITVAKVDDKVRLQSVETWFDPMEMFRQISAGRNENEIIRGEMVDSDVEDAKTHDKPEIPVVVMRDEIPSQPSETKPIEAAEDAIIKKLDEDGALIDVKNDINEEVLPNQGGAYNSATLEAPPAPIEGASEESINIDSLKEGSSTNPDYSSTTEKTLEIVPAEGNTESTKESSEEGIEGRSSASNTGSCPFLH